MKTAIVHPNTLLGQAVRERLEQSSRLEAPALLATDEEKVGTLSESGGEAALLQLLNGTEADLYFACGDIDQQMEAANMVRDGTVVHVGDAAQTPYSVAKIAPPTADSIRVYCPSPANIALAHFLSPLAEFGPSGSAVVLSGASALGSEALDELLDQTRAILAFTGDIPTEHLHQQLAFNVIAPESMSAWDEFASIVPECSLTLNSIQAGIFHGSGIEVDLRFASQVPTADQVGELLNDLPYFKVYDKAEPLGTVEAAGGDVVQVSRIVATDSGVAAWMAFDNLTLAARNAVEIGEEIAARRLAVN